ncbi:histidine kinase [Micromonospora sp. WMMD1076]|uniref:histidine kinase n=1 Tax=Micromonospora TaxID=1873 RepID=UPI00249B4804|nr:histidine kinase [Micromonospora sp. WMMD1076]WFF10003.1 histidine kinase [Micromonospora sp. WMMD1076]
MRIAGEVHDVAGRGLALMAMQAAVGLLILQKPDQARRALEAIRPASARCATSSRAGSASPTGGRAAISRPPTALVLQRQLACLRW